VVRWSCGGGCGLFEVVIPLSEKEKAEMALFERATVNLAFSRRWRRRLRLQRKGLFGEGTTVSKEIG